MRLHIRFRSRCAVAFSMLALLAAAPTVSTAQDVADPNSGSDPFEGEVILRVEEDWLADVAEATDVNTAPEIVTVFGPSNANGTHAIFEMNHATYPEFAPGGMQLQCWWSDWFLGSRRHYNQSQLLTSVERVRYTCATELKDGKLVFEIRNGSSVTFGDFGGEGYLKLSLWTERDSLNSYDPEQSVALSRVTYGANRVNRFVRTAIRYYSAAGDVFVDEQDRVVHQLVEAELGPAPVNE